MGSLFCEVLSTRSFVALLLPPLLLLPLLLLLLPLLPLPLLPPVLPLLPLLLPLALLLPLLPLFLDAPLSLLTAAGAAVTRRRRRARVAFTLTSKTVKGLSLGFWIVTSPDRRRVTLLTDRVTCRTKTVRQGESRSTSNKSVRQTHTSRCCA
jgi:hypothetical protein